MRHFFTAIMLAFLSGCAASYSNLTFQSALSQADTVEAKKNAAGNVTSKYADDFSGEVAELYEQGYELVGYSKFKAALVPRMAEWNSRIAAKSQGASFVLLAQPQPANMGQHQYLFTYWRAGKSHLHLFGAQYIDAPAEVLGMLGCSANMVSIAAVAPDSPASDAGIVTGDVIAAVNESAVYNARQLDDALMENSGRTVQLRLLRSDESRVVSVTLGATAIPTAEDKVVSNPGLGLQFIETSLSEKQAEALGEKQGQMIRGIDYGGYACGSELRYGDLLLGVGLDKIVTVDQIDSALEKYKGQKTTIDIWRGGVKRVMELDLTSPALASADDVRRQPIFESQFENPPWISAKNKDFTWATVSALVVKGVAQGYSNYLEAERQRAIAYNRAEAQRLASGPTVYQNSRGRWNSVDRYGNSFEIDAGTAALLKSNPGYTVSKTQMRGNNFSVYDRYGNTIASSPGRASYVTAVTPVSLPDGWYDNYMQRMVNKSSLIEYSSKQAVYGGPFNNAYLNGR